MSITALALLALILLMGLSILWSTLRCGMPPMPSLGRSRQAMLSLLQEAPRGAIVDMGSGWGTLAVAFARRFPENQVIGYEISFFPWLFSVFLARVLGLRNLRFYRLDFRNAQLMGVTALVCYLMPGGMEAIRRRLEAEPGSVEVVISHCFALRGWKADDIVEMADLYRTPVYRYCLNQGSHAT